MNNLTQCRKCQHKNKGGTLLTCLAYPTGIPYVIFSGEVKHNHIIEGQTGDYTYLAKPEHLGYDEQIHQGAKLLKNRRNDLKEEVVNALLGFVPEQEEGDFWEKIVFDFEVLGNRVYQVHDLFIMRFNKTTSLENMLTDELRIKATQLIKVEAIYNDCSRLKLIISMQENKAEFKFQ